jgi:hypothetical protein
MVAIMNVFFLLATISRTKVGGAWVVCYLITGSRPCVMHVCIAVGDAKKKKNHSRVGWQGKKQRGNVVSTTPDMDA